MSVFAVANDALALATKTAAEVAALPPGTGGPDIGDFDATDLTKQVNALTDKVNALTDLVGVPTDGSGTTPAPTPTPTPTPAPMLTAGAGASPGSPFASTQSF